MIKDKVVLDSICEKFINMVKDFYDIPGIAVGVYCDVKESSSVDGGAYIFTGAGGYRNYETKDMLQPNTVFHCTSVSKLFTAMGVMKLVEQGKLSLSERFCDVVPWLSIADKRWEDITIEALLTHTSGLTDVNDYHWEEHKTDDGALKEYALSGEVAERRLLWDPAGRDEEGSKSGLIGRFRYSSMAYDLLGLVIAEISGVSFEEFMMREIFVPLEMNDTTFMTCERIKKHIKRTNSSKTGDVFLLAVDDAKLAMPHCKGRDRVIRIEETYPYTRQHAPSSTLTSTAGDLLKWAEALMMSASLHEGSIKEMWTPRVEVPDTGEQMGLGWFIRKQEMSAGNGEAREYILAGHEGSDDGFRTSFWMCPELGIATVLLCNLTDAPLKKLNKQLLEKVLK